MAEVVVTGAAGFIGSWLAERLVDDGHHVRGVDCFTPYYAERKPQNLRRLADEPSFELLEVDLRSEELAPVVEGAEVVYHLAAQPGVRDSWGTFGDYLEHNVLATQRLLEACRLEPGITRVVYSSSSSVYGKAPSYPTREIDPEQPHSPYGVTKLAGEQLSVAYAANWGVPTVALRYFTVYGPRQRPDMAIHRMISAALSGEPFPLFGDGSHVRDFTYVDDVVEANLRAAGVYVPPGAIFNVAGGAETTVRDLIELVGRVVGATVAVQPGPEQPGDVPRTGGAIERAREQLGWEPKVGLEEGVRSQAAWQRDQG